MGSHLIDQALAHFGMPDWVQADLARQRPGQIADDCFEIRMGIGQMRISLGSSTLAADSVRFIRILGAEGAFYKAGLDPQEPTLRAGGKPGDPDYGVEDEAHWGRITDASGAVRVLPSEHGNWAAFYRQMRAAIEAGAPAPVPLEDTWRLVRLIDAVMDSAKSGKRLRFV